MDVDLLNEVKKLIGDKLTCPANMQELNKVIELKNKLTKQLNNLYEKINSISDFVNPIDKLIDTTEKAITPAQTAIDIASNIPSSAVTPIPVGPIIAGQKLINNLNYTIGKSKGTIEIGTSSISTLTFELQKVMDLLNMVDLFTKLCAEEIGAKGGEGGEMLVQTQVSQELISSTQNQSNQLSPVVTNVNGFDMGVETEITGDPLKRRRAIAKNTQGVAVLKGEYSYSSNDQILIDELVFYIQQNNLKV